jgi:hypothetical protein
VPFDLLDALGMVGEAATEIPDLRKRRNRIGCFIGFALLLILIAALTWWS